jgi:hypothetical protein
MDTSTGLRTGIHGSSHDPGLLGCARPESHAHGCMSAAVRERKEEARKAKKAAEGGADSGKQTLITRVTDSLERLGGEHDFYMVTALWIYPEVQRAAQAYEQNGETEAFDKVVGKFSQAR